MEIPVASFFQIDYTNDDFDESVGMLPTKEQPQKSSRLSWHLIVLNSVTNNQKFCRGIDQ